jgi:tRNA dimethylallyltransferase
MSPILIAGPTAVGKSALALELAGHLGGEIISVDSMQVYRGLDIGTSKPNAAERARCVHHLVDVVDLGGAFDAACFVRETTAAVEAITGRGKIPVLCGGTGLYINAWLNGLGSAPPPDPVLRAELEAMPLETLLDELARKDWETFDSIDLKNRRRLVRAVEVIRLTGLPFSRQRAAWPDRAPSMAGRAFGLRRSREDLVDRIHRRVDAMFAAGLVEETRRLMAVGLEGNRVAMQAIGYRQVVEHLRGERGFRETVEQVKIRTRQYAKRQMTWFDGQLDLDWIEVACDEPPAVSAAKVLERLRKK